MNTTTHFCTPLRFGRRFQLIVNMKSEEEIRKDLEGLDFHPDIERGTPEYKDRQRVKQMRRRLSGSPDSDSDWDSDEDFPALDICDRVLKVTARACAVLPSIISSYQAITC